MNTLTMTTIKAYYGRKPEALLGYEPQGFDLMRVRKVGRVIMADIR